MNTAVNQSLDLVEARQLCKDLEYLCEDKSYLEEIIDEYVYLVAKYDPARLEVLQEYVINELKSDF